MSQTAIAPRPISPDEMIAAGLRAFFEIAQKWDLKPAEEMTLLGGPSRATYYKWKSGDYGKPQNSRDLTTRLSLIIGIFKALELIYAAPGLADRWVRAPNEAFGGQSALERMLAGEITDLDAVRSYLDSARGGW